jgi:hypothetical protein
VLVRVPGTGNLTVHHQRITRSRLSPVRLDDANDLFCARARPVLFAMSQYSMPSFLCSPNCKVSSVQGLARMLDTCLLMEIAFLLRMGSRVLHFLENLSRTVPGTWMQGYSKVVWNRPWTWGRLSVKCDHHRNSVCLSSIEQNSSITVVHTQLQQSRFA